MSPIALHARDEGYMSADGTDQNDRRIRRKAEAGRGDEESEIKILTSHVLQLRNEFAAWRAWQLQTHSQTMMFLNRMNENILELQMGRRDGAAVAGAVNINNPNPFIDANLLQTNPLIEMINPPSLDHREQADCKTPTGNLKENNEEMSQPLDSTSANAKTSTLDLDAKLSKIPKTLQLLWEEWENGIDGNKPAKLFTSQERGQDKVKHNFYKRKFFWNKCHEMIQGSGMSARSACNLIYNVYGTDKSVSYILDRLKRDKIDRGGHPDLSIDKLPQINADDETTDDRTEKRFGPSTRPFRPRSLPTKDGNLDATAKLSNRPKTLETLWVEWDSGVDNNKPAKLFTNKERRHKDVKHQFYRRKFFWNKASKLVESGMTSENACNKIYDVYGRGKPVSYYLERLMRDEIDRGGHPELDVAVSDIEKK